MTTLAPTPPTPSPLMVFRNRNFTRLWLGQLVGEMDADVIE